MLLDKALALEPRSAVKLALRSTLNLKLGDAKAAFKDTDAAVAADGKLGLAFAARARAMAALTPDYAPRQVLADYAAAAEYKRALAQYENGGGESPAAEQGASGADFFGKAGLGGGPAQNGFWASLPTQARKKWPQGLVMLGGGFLLLFWLWKKLRQAASDEP